MRLQELQPNRDKLKKVQQFAAWAVRKLGITGSPQIKYTSDKNRVNTHRTFGATKPTGEIWVYLGNRNTADIMRTLCHELVHYRQFEKGSAKEQMTEPERLRIEDEANAVAGRMMREYGKQHVDIYEAQQGDIQITHREIPPNAMFRYGAINVSAQKDGENIGGVMFAKVGDHSLMGVNVVVNKKYRGQGVATRMYEYAQNLGYTVLPNEADHTPDGRAMWDAWRRKGRNFDRLAEGRFGSLQHEVGDSLPQAFVIPGLSASDNPYMQYKFGVAIAGVRGANARKYDDVPNFDISELNGVWRDDEVVISYDPHIGEIIDKALKDIGVKGGKRRIGVKGSKESPDVPKGSPIKPFRGYK
jgi:GNAT superfamily N-acetyltransferase